MVKMKDQMKDIYLGENCLWPRYHADMNEPIEICCCIKYSYSTDPIQWSQQNMAILLERMGKALKKQGVWSKYYCFDWEDPRHYRSPLIGNENQKERTSVSGRN